mgnify:CR=1 FL=1
MIIRQEKQNDFKEIYTVVKEAFASTEHSDGTEQDLVVALRNGNAYIPDLALVAEKEGKIIGHIMFSKAYVEDVCVLALAPLSVLPDFQLQGIGLALINEGHKRAKELGYSYSVVLGHEKYYPKAGYAPAKNCGIEPPFEVPEKNFMAIKLGNDVNEIHGTLKYADEFGIS